MGKQGDKGDTGDAGEKGAKGDEGDKGDSGMLIFMQFSLLISVINQREYNLRCPNPKQAKNFHVNVIFEFM